MFGLLMVLTFTVHPERRDGRPGGRPADVDRRDRLQRGLGIRRSA
jgi:hypothetical protein